MTRQSSIQLDLAPGYEIRERASSLSSRALGRLRRALGGEITSQQLRRDGASVSATLADLKAIDMATRLSPLDDYEYQRLPRRETIEALVERGVLLRRQVGSGADRFFSLLRRPESAQLFFVFSGNKGRMGLRHDSFLTETGLIDRNVVILRDVGQQNYTAGLSPRIADFAGLVTWQEGIRTGLGIDREQTYIMGNSAGAYTAMLSGHHLGAAAVWAFAPPRLASRGGDSSSPPADLDLTQVLAVDRAVTIHNVFFSEGHERDRSVARGLAGLPGVELNPQPGRSHDVLSGLLASNRLAELLPPNVTRSPLHAPQSAEQREAAVVEFLALLTGRDPIALRHGEPLRLDSLAVVQLTDFVETRLGRRLSPASLERIPDSSLPALIEMVERANVAETASVEDISVSRPRPTDDAAHTYGRGERLDNQNLITDIEIGMPLTGRNNLAESPLLKLAADRQWHHTEALSGVPSAATVDSEGNRLYATLYFVECQMPAPAGMAAFGENDRFSIVSSLQRFGSSMLEGCHVLAPPGTVEVSSLEADAYPTIRLSSSFVRQWQGAGWLKKSRPASAGFAQIPEVDEPPRAYRLVKAAQDGAPLFDGPHALVPLAIATAPVEIPIEADRDLNGAGLLYFANYPVFLDIAERSVLRSAGLSDDLLNRRSLLHRRSAYLSNASADDVLEIAVTPWLLSRAGAAEAASWAIVQTDFSMRRKSDGRVMMLSSARKTFTGLTDDDQLALRGLAIEFSAN